MEGLSGTVAAAVAVAASCGAEDRNDVSGLGGGQGGEGKHRSNDDISNDTAWSRCHHLHLSWPQGEGGGQLRGEVLQGKSDERGGGGEEKGEGERQKI